MEMEMEMVCLEIKEWIEAIFWLGLAAFQIKPRVARVQTRVTCLEEQPINLMVSREAAQTQRT
jgi:hypothetical protein